MKKLAFAALAVLLCAACILIWLKCCPTTTTSLPKLEINEAGALINIRDQNGQPVFGNERSPSEGYFITYQLMKSGSNDPAGPEKIIQATSDGYTVNSIRCPECEKRKSEYEKTAIALSTDNALAINTNFVLDPKTQRLKVYRLIQNVSGDPEINTPTTVKLIAVQFQYNQILESSSPTRLGVLKNIKELKPESPVQLQVSLFSRLFTPSVLAAGLACQWCPNQCDFTLQYGANERGEICIDCPNLNDTERKIGVFFNGGKLASSHPSNETPPPVNCDNKLIVEPFVLSTSAPGVITNKAGQEQIVCISCPRKVEEGVSEFSARCFANIGPLLSVAQIKANYGCELTVTIQAGQTKKLSSAQNSSLRFPSSVAQNLPVNYLADPGQGGQDRSNGIPTNFKNSLEPGEGLVFVTEYEIRRK